MELTVLVVTLNLDVTKNILNIERGTEVLPDEIISNMVVYLPSFFDSCFDEGIDIVTFVNPPVGEAQDGDALAMVFLNAMFSQNMLNDPKLEAILWERLTKQGSHLQQMEMKRTGGANGNPLPTSMSTQMLLAIQGQSPRQARSTVFTFTQTCIRISYISPYKQQHTLCRFNYPPVKPASVLKDFDLLSLSPVLRRPMVAFLHAKAFTVSVLELLNEGRGQETNESTYFKVSQEAGLVQRVTNIAATVYAKSKAKMGTDEYKLQFCQFLSKTCCFTVMSYAAGFHHDKIGKNVFHYNHATNIMRPCTRNLFEALLPGARECGVNEAELRDIFFSLSKITAFVENKMLLRMKKSWIKMHPKGRIPPMTIPGTGLV
jgi:hypothetical protein